MVALVLLWLGFLHDTVRAENSNSFCRGDIDEEALALLETRIPEDFAADVDTVWDLVRKLHQHLNIPLSFIEDRTGEPIAFPIEERTLEDLLRAIADQYERYRCEAYGGRLVMRSSDPVFDEMISGVDIVDEYRYPARDAYLEHLRSFDERFKAWQGPLWAMAGLSPVFVGRVTLSPRAPVVLHLVQLLGKDPVIYFEVPAPSQYLWRTVMFRAVRRPPNQIPPVATPPPIDKSRKEQ